jgi:hypothetical protein
MKLGLTLIIATLYLCISSCSILLVALYPIYPGKPNEGSFDIIKQENYKKNTECVLTNGFYTGNFMSRSGTGQWVAIFFKDGRFCMDNCELNDTLTLDYMINAYNRNYQKAYYYGFYYCEGDSLYTEYVHEERQGAINLYFRRTFNCHFSDSITSSYHIYKRKGTYRKEQLNLIFIPFKE